MAGKLRSLASDVPTKEDVLAEIRRADLRPLWIGRYAHLWSSTQADRCEALRELKADLVRDDFISVAARLDQYIVVYFVAWLLGWDEAQSLRLEAMKALRRLVAQNQATGEYQLRRQCERPARALWAQMVRDAHDGGRGAGRGRARSCPASRTPRSTAGPAPRPSSSSS